MKKKLFILEGFDRIGKDTALLELKNKFKDNKKLLVYIQDPNRKVPDYRDNEAFRSWLVNYLDNQSNELIKYSEKYNKIIMCRFFISDYVYSTLFNRENTAELYRERLEEYFEIHNIILLWHSYKDYLKRCAKTKSNIEYTIEEFDKIQTLYEEKHTDNDLFLYFDNSDNTGKFLSDTVIF